MVTEKLEKFCGSVFWDTNLTWNTNNPDFTECFQQTVLLWVSMGILWILAPLEIYYIVTQKHQRIPWTALNVSKLVLNFMLMAENIIDFIYVIQLGIRQVEVSPADMWAPIIKFLTFTLAFILTVAGKIHGLHSSGVLLIFWTLVTITGAVTYRTRIIQAVTEDEVTDIYTFSLTAVSFPIVLAQLVLSTFADTVIPEKDEEKKPSPYKRASVLSVAFFSWFDKLVWLGFRRQLTEDDMWTLDSEYRSEQVTSEFEKLWVPKEVPPVCNESLLTSSPIKKMPSVWKVLWKMNRFNFNMSIILKLFADALTFVNPLMLRELINFVSSPNEPVWRGYLYTVVIFVATLMQTMTTHNYFFRLQTIGIRARATIISAVYRKSLRMSPASKRASTTGEIVNLMSVDAQRIHDFWPYVGYAITTPLQVGAALYLLWELLGPSVFAGLGIVIVIIPVNLILAGKVAKLQTELMKQKDQRTKLMNEVLSGIKVLKLYAWEMSFYKQINDIRAKELRILKKFLYLNSVTTLLFQFTPFLISLTTFATYVLLDKNNILDASKAFVSLTLFDLIRYPLTYVPIVISYTVQAMISVRRVNKFLGKPELDLEQITEITEISDADIVIEKGTFAWDRDEDPILYNINLSVPRAALVAVVGSVGSGKSSLMSAILGEMEKCNGTVSRKLSVAYVSQQAWIQNTTLCQNILFGRPLDEKKYQAVIEACALKPDLEILPGGDQTEIGEKGINLSGGQKQRISLARAVYQNADMYILDDPLSAVDAHVGKHIFEKVIGPEGLLSKKTRILVTHGLAYLPFVDSVIVMTNGTISEMGSYRELLEAGGAFADFIMMYLKDETEIDEAEVAELLEIQENILSKIKNPELKRKISVRISQALSSEEEYMEGSKSSSQRRSSGRTRSNSGGYLGDSYKSKELSTKAQHANLTQIEQVETGSVGWYVYYYYLKSSGSSLCIAAFLVLVVSWTAAVGSNVWLSVWSGDKPLADGSQDSGLRDLRLGVYAGLGSAQALFGFFAAIVLVWANIRASTTLHNDMLMNILRSPMSFFDTTPMGRVMNRFARDVDIVDSTIPSFIRPLGDSFLQIIGVIIVICMGTPMFAAVLVPLGLLYYLIQRIFINSSRQMKRLESVTRSPIFSHFSETLAGLSTIRAYRQQCEFTRASDVRVDVNHMIIYPFLVAKRWLAIRLDLVGATVVFFAALLAVMGRNTMDPGTVGLSISYGLSITFVLTLMVRYWTELESNSISIERLKEYSETPTEAPWKNKTYQPVTSWPQEGHIEFQEYTTRYREGLDLVLKGISCDIKSGEKIGIVGRTGAGKSSLTLALFRIIENAGGKITIDGINIAKLGLHDLRSRLTIIPQDPVLFCGTLRMNLDPFDTYTDDEVWRTLELAHLKDFVSTLVNGLEHEISEGGENLSVGQRQLVCLARALLRKTKVLVLDEATAAVDLETDDLIQATIRKEFADCTVLTIAHRLNTILDSNRVMVLQNGVIQEFDSPANLLENQQSIFFSMAKDAGLI